MRFKFYSILESLILLAMVLFCEVGYYHYNFKVSCPGWPKPSGKGHQNLTRILVLADTHIMGQTKSVLLDKLRREWEMEQSYSISISIFKPDLVIFLGDIFDEGSFSRDEIFDKNSDEYDRIFPQHPDQHRIVIVGNHDIGYHDKMVMFPYTMYRFGLKFQATSNIKLTKFRDLHIVTSNSMSFYNDTCPSCSQSIAETNVISKYLDNQEATDPSGFSSPILLTHIPLYRYDDTSCDHESQRLLQKKNVEGEDVIHKTASQFILEKLKPRLILSGHTHMNCINNHTTSKHPEKVFQEITVSSFNHKYAEDIPGYLLISANSTHIFTRQCDLIDERLVFGIYAIIIFVISYRLFSLIRGRFGFISK